MVTVISTYTLTNNIPAEIITKDILLISVVYGFHSRSQYHSNQIRINIRLI